MAGSARRLEPAIPMTAERTSDLSTPDSASSEAARKASDGVGNRDGHRVRGTRAAEADAGAIEGGDQRTRRRATDIDSEN